MSESAKELSSKRGDIILGPADGSVINGKFVSEIGGTRIDSVVEAGRSYIITFNSNDSEWANMPLYRTPGNIRTPLKQFNSNTYIVKFTADGTETGIGIANLGSGRTLSVTNHTLYEYKEPDNVLRPFMADKMYYRNQEVQKLYLGSRLLWELPSEPTVSEPTFTLVGRHFDKPQNLPYIMIRKKDFEKFGVDPTTVTAITVNGERYDVTRVGYEAFSVYLHIENADNLALNGSETLTIHYQA